jgi:hypothetical protein
MNLEKQYWEAVAKAVADAVSITWDGCHKIYIHMDEGQHDTAVSYGHEPIRVTDADEAIKTLRDWFDRSCELRFINAVRTVDGDPNDGYDSLIPQFAE